jgi:tetratricopeptide (TPR) repeat protein
MNPHFERASALLQTGRTQMAAEELRLCLAEDPNFAPAHSMLALCLAELGQMQQAEDEAVAGIGLAADSDFSFYALGSVRMERNDFRGAIAAASEATRLDPDDADNWLLEARARIALRQWHMALEAADRGLRCDPEHVECNNMRAFALVQLGRGEEAEHTLEASLNRDPENVGTHAHQGWALLNAGDRVKALEHYREAMRLDPNNEFARMGIVETLKARNFIYRAFLRYFLFMSRQKGWVQWAIILGVLFGQDALRMISDALPVAAPYIMPLYYVLIVLVLGSWMANPMFNLLLRLDREGRHALSETQIRETNLFGGVLALGIVCALAGWVFDVDLLLLAGVGCGFLLLPLACTFAVQRGWPRTVMVMGSATLALMGAAIVGGAALAEFGDNQQAFDFSMGLIAPFLWGCVLSTWASLILSAFVPKR